MAARLGNVLFWACCAVAGLLFVGSQAIGFFALFGGEQAPFPEIAYVFTYPYFEHLIPLYFLQTLALVVFIVGIALRYILSGVGLGGSGAPQDEHDRRVSKLVWLFLFFAMGTITCLFSALIQKNSLLALACAGVTGIGAAIVLHLMVVADAAARPERKRRFELE